MEQDSTASKALSRSQVRRQQDIINAALAAFDQHGFERARIDDIAKQAGVAKGTVYLYFKNKEQLFHGVVRHVVEPALEQVKHVAAGETDSASERLRQQVNAFGQLLSGHDFQVILRLLISEGPNNPAIRSFYYHSIVAPGMRAFQQCLKEGEEKGEFKSGTGELCPQLLAGAPIVSAVWQILFADFSPLDIHTLINQQLSVFLEGVSAT